jgi:PBP1b-binding outer membrane lipoprotein LpoB
MKKIIFIVTLFSMVLTGCEYDNYDPPTSILSGKVKYQNEPVNVRSNGTQLELWQDGYALRAKIAVYIDQDGNYSAALFDGNYKLVRLAGAPWENQTDTIPVTVKGNTVVDVPVNPYFVVRNVSFQKEGSNITGKFTIEKISASANLSLARLYLGKTLITDQNNNAANATINASAITVGQETTVSLSIPASLASEDYLFARIGVQTQGVGELYYSVPQKIQLK